MTSSTHSHSAVRSIRNSRALKKWAVQFNTTPEIVRAAVQRVGSNADLVRQYVAGQPNRWQTDLFGR
jgi:hypothetical protein